ncbi:MAG TPA: 3-deoxy-manno-octulosonate cytidylyltransferase [bacterium]|nr:3-deoxy-manno-octulosonate cytidylyltransferase [bacterium]
MKVVAIIPARYASVRFPGKVLAPIAGKPMIQRVWERATQAREVSEVIVATDHERVAEAVAGFGGRVIMTAPDRATGTERVAEAADKIEADVIINVQGDEPIIAPDSLDLVVQPFLDDDTAPVTSLMFPIESFAEYMDPNVVKVICDASDNAIYFSRSPIPHYRDGRELIEQWEKQGKRPAGLKPGPMKHIGVYAYRADFLQALVRMPVSELEEAERLEQLRVLAWGFHIKMVATPHDSISVDVPADVARVEAVIAKLKL